MTEEQVKNLSGSKKLAITLGSGLTAGVAAAVLSQVSFSAPDCICMVYIIIKHLLICLDSLPIRCFLKSIEDMDRKGQ